MGMIINVVKKQFPKVKNIDTETLNQWLKNTIASMSSKMAATAGGDSKSEQQPPQSPKIALLDVRPEKEYQISFIPSARRVDPEEQDMKKLLQLINEVAPSSEPDKRVQVVMYCSVGYRASILATRLEEFLEKEEEWPRRVAANRSTRAERLDDPEPKLVG
ncbi:hypothetical protein BSL78_02786 [Apostichopus japonicus]|uniref:Rhodanese domain-containing protein n=1 Tax=Stichopus japonicus TaxID=307972 RepID=A0A2G8LJD3_STIJA|nr:hypothetical protein BSL78_02786 [Apostichopus japonicus]